MRELAIIRFFSFVGVFAVMAVWEMAAPRRGRVDSKWRRWLNNLGLMVSGTLLARVLLPVFPMKLAGISAANNWGLLNNVEMAFGIKLILSILALDLVIYIQHVLFHYLPLLWRLHKVHHVDLDLDVTSGVRFHPLEILLSYLIKCLAILVIGPSVWAVIGFEIILNGMAMFNHANATLPGWLDRLLRVVLVTPDVHRVHHSTIVKETNSNFGFNLSVWDRLFGTYSAQPRWGHLDMTIGLNAYLKETRQRFLWLLVLPFKRKRSH